MSEYERAAASNATLDEILEEIRSKRSASSGGSASASPEVKKWSMDDIDRLIAGEKVENPVAEEKNGGDNAFASIFARTPQPSAPAAVEEKTSGDNAFASIFAHAPQPSAPAAVEEKNGGDNAFASIFAHAPQPSAPAAVEEKNGGDNTFASIFARTPQPSAPAEDEEEYEYEPLFGEQDGCEESEISLAPPVEKDEQLSKILSDEFDSSIFTLRTPEGTAAHEMQDISSVSENAPLPEVEGQESFFEDVEEPEEFDIEIETVIVPDEAPPAPVADKYIQSRVPSPPLEPQRPVIAPAPAEEDNVLDFFKKKSAERSELFESNEFRTRFFNKLQLEKTAEIDEAPEGPVDKSGIVVERRAAPRADGSDLQPLPKIVAAEDLLKAEEGLDGKTIVMGSAAAPVIRPPKNEDANVDGQIVLTGFEEEHIEAQPVPDDETDVEKELWEKRRQKAKTFKVTDAPELEGVDDETYAARIRRDEERIRRKERRNLEDEAPGAPDTAEEYTMTAERVAVHSRLNRAVSKANASLVVSAVFEAIFIILWALPKILKAQSFDSVVLCDGSTALLTVNAVLLIVLAAVFSDKIVAGVSALFALKPTADSAVSLATAAALIQTAVAAIFGKGAMTLPIFPAAAAAGFIFTSLARRADAERILENFEICAYKKEHNLYAIHRFDNEAEIFELGRGLMMGNAELLYSSKIGFPSDFIKNSAGRSAEEKTVKLLLPSAAAAALVAGAISGIVTKDFYMALSVFTGALCICSPVLASLCPAWVTRSSNFNLNATGSMIVSLDTAEKTNQANAVVIDSADIFDRSRCVMHGMKDFNNIRIDDVLLYAAALVIKSGGPLRESFEQVAGNRQDLLPPVKELVYEDKLGIAARIHGQKVLLGNRSLLTNHSIDVPNKTFEDKYTHSGRKVMYLAVAGKIAALFVVSYAVDKSLTPYIQELESNGIQILVRTNDVNVTEDMLARAFGVPKQSFKILSSVASRLYKRRRDAVTDRLSVRLLHDGTAYSMLRTVAAAGKMSSAARLGTGAQIALSIIGFAAATAFGCLELTKFFNSFTAIIFAAAAAAVVWAVVSLKKIR